MDNPLHQFVVKPLIPLSLGGIDISFTNASLAMVLTVMLIALFFGCGLKKKALIPDGAQAYAEMGLSFIHDLVEDNIGSPSGSRFFPFILTLFFFILVGNLLGMIPYAYTFTSQLIVTFALASLVFVVVTLVGFIKHGFKFFSYFLPQGVPVFLAPFIIVVEFISYLSRPVSLSIRLFANMMAGHTMLKVFALFTVALGLYGASTIMVNTVLVGFEFLVAFLQAYVFSVLSCLYLKDAIHLH